MNTFLQDTYNRLLTTVSTDRHRYLYEQFHINNQLTGIIGARGVGKTTLMLQYIKEKLADQKNVFYVSADNIYFNEHTLLAFVTELYEVNGIEIFFIDEIHRYANWNQELKNIYDSFPMIKVIFSGSSSIDLVKGSYDLSRRAKLFHLDGLSFREYLYFTTGLEAAVISYADLLAHPAKIAAELAAVPQLKGHFQHYLESGYYPFQLQDTQLLYEQLQNIIDKTIYEDIANFYNLKTANLSYFKRILNFLASIPPGEITINNIAHNLQIDNKTTDAYMQMLTEANLVRMVSVAEGGNQLLRKPSKIFIHNTTLLSALNHYLNVPVSKGTLRELFFLQALSTAGHTVFYSKIGDYQVNNHYFEIGGKNKSSKQIATHENAWRVLDDILHPAHGVLPLYIFGFLY